jgi:hypothetical protein
MPVSLSRVPASHEEVADLGFETRALATGARLEPKKRLFPGRDRQDRERSVQPTSWRSRIGKASKHAPSDSSLCGSNISLPPWAGRASPCNLSLDKTVSDDVTRTIPSG